MLLEWKKIKEDKYQTGYRKMLKKVFRLPDNRVVDFDIKQEDPAACILAITKNNKIILAKQYRPGPEKILMEMPGGKIDPQETAEKAIKRELLEETGYLGDIQFVGTTLDCAYSTMIRYNYIAKNCKKIQEPQNEANEFIEVVKLTMEEFRQLLRNGEMTDIESGYLCLDFLENKNNWNK